MGQAPKTDLLLAFMTGSSPGNAHVWTYCSSGCTDGTASNQKLLKLQLNTQDWIQRGWGWGHWEEKGYYGSQESNVFCRKEPGPPPSSCLDSATDVVADAPAARPRL